MIGIVRDVEQLKTAMNQANHDFGELQRKVDKQDIWVSVFSYTATTFFTVILSTITALLITETGRRLLIRSC